jgi:hypothetical protein
VPSTSQTLSKRFTVLVGNFSIPGILPSANGVMDITVDEFMRTWAST